MKKREGSTRQAYYSSVCLVKWGLGLVFMAETERKIQVSRRKKYLHRQTQRWRERVCVFYELKIALKREEREEI